MAASAATTSRPALTRRLLGRHPVGYLFVAPYVLFLFAIFAYPLGFAVYMSFHDYFFAAPGAIVERPFVGLDNYTTALADPVFHRAMLNVVIFIAINVPLTVFVGLILATALNAAIPFRTFFRASYFVPYVTASVAVIGVWQWMFNSDGLVNSVLGPLAPGTVLAGQPLLGDADHRPVRHLEAARLLRAAVPGRPPEHPRGAVRGGRGRRGRAGEALHRRHPARGPPTTTLVVIAATITGANFFTEPYLLTGRGGPAGASVSPVLLIYTQGIEQGKAGYAAAIGVLLAVGVMVISLVNRHLLEGADRGHRHPTPAAQPEKPPPSGNHDRAPDPPLPAPPVPPARPRPRRTDVPVPLLLHGHRGAAARAEPGPVGSVP